jgi:UDP-N-acetyl-D-glucosamine dehydrogenase
VVYEAMGIDVHEVINAAATKPFGFMAFRPGPGLGGHCIPIDPFYLTWKAREFGKHTRFIELAGEINTAMPDYVISKVADALNDEGKAIKGSNILILGLAYKANVDDCRESPSFVLMEKLEAKGATVEYNDSFVPVVPPTREHSHFIGKQSVEIEDAYDLILVSTDHADYKTFDFSSYACPLVDSRNCITKKPKKYYHA